MRGHAASITTTLVAGLAAGVVLYVCAQVIAAIGLSVADGWRVIDPAQCEVFENHSAVCGDLVIPSLDD